MIPDRETQPTWTAVRRFALEAEAAGFDSLWVIDDPMHCPGRRVEMLGVLGCIPTVGRKARALARLRRTRIPSDRSGARPRRSSLNPEKADVGLSCSYSRKRP